MIDALNDYMCTIGKGALKDSYEKEGGTALCFRKFRNAFCHLLSDLKSYVLSKQGFAAKLPCSQLRICRLSKWL